VSEHTRGLTLRIDGGSVSVNGQFAQVLNATLDLPDNATSFVEVSAGGVVSSNTTSFTSGRSYLYKVVTLSGKITSIVDWRHGAIDPVPTASAGAAPAGGTGATAGAYDTAVNRDALITLVNAMRTALIANGIMT
jgi:hypothetical protein